MLLVIGIAAAAAALLVLATSPRDGGQMALGAGLAAAFVACVMAARQGTKVGDGGVRLQYAIRSRSLEWDTIVCFKIADVRGVLGERLRKPAAVLRTGEAVPLPGADRFSLLPRNADRMSFPVVDRLEATRRERRLRAP